MGRIFGILLFVLALWFTANSLVEMRAPDDDTPAAVDRSQKVRESVLRAHEEGAARREKLLPE